MTENNRPKPLMLCILDGWGYREEITDDNAIVVANTPVWDRMLKQYPHGLIDTYGKFVGLPDGQMGNSEVGHMNIGAGRVVMQDLPKIEHHVENNTLKDQPNLVKFIKALQESKGVAHLLGLVSPGGVHSHQRDIAALAKIFDDAGVPVRIHAFTDGRDTPPDSGKGFLTKLRDDIKGLKDCRIVSAAGRYYAMDRDNRWERVQKAYDTIVAADAPRFDNALDGIQACYDKDVTDEFVEPFIIGDYAGMNDGDGAIFANFRADRVREITDAMFNSAFKGFERKKIVKFSGKLGMTEYSSEHMAFMDAVFPHEEVHNVLGEIISRAGMKQLRIAETEKYAHVTYFFNGGNETQFEGEDRVLIPSAKVATYDLKPEMEANAITDKLVEVIEANTYDVIIVNYANGDMVGHTGKMEAAVKTAEVIDACLARLENTMLKVGGAMLVTADHGNLEKMKDENGNPYTAHTVGKVYCIYVGGDKTIKAVKDGALKDLAPTMLDILSMDKPAEMSGVSLIEKG